MKKLNKKGFTLVELVIVIAVIAILAAVLIPTFSGVIAKANESKALQEARNAMTADLLLANGDYANMNNVAYNYAKTKDTEKVSTKTYYTITDNVATKTTTEADVAKLYERVVDEYAGTFADDKYTYEKGGYKCVYDTVNGEWKVTK